MAVFLDGMRETAITVALREHEDWSAPMGSTNAISGLVDFLTKFNIQTVLKLVYQEVQPSHTNILNITLQLHTLSFVSVQLVLNFLHAFHVG